MTHPLIDTITPDDYSTIAAKKTSAKLWAAGKDSKAAPARGLPSR